MEGAEHPHNENAGSDPHRVAVMKLAKSQIRNRRRRQSQVFIIADFR